jgi:hypothetical protein
LEVRRRGAGIQQLPGIVEAGVGLVNRAPHAVIRYGEEVSGAWASVGVMGQPGKKRNGSGLKRIITFSIYSKKF